MCSLSPPPMSHIFIFFFFFNDTATTEIYTLSLHDALPISADYDRGQYRACLRPMTPDGPPILGLGRHRDRKSTRLNSSHSQISYAVFCLKKKKPPRDLTGFQSTNSKASLHQRRILTRHAPH